MSGPTAVVLDGELTIYRAGEVHQEILVSIANAPEAVSIDLLGVTELDSAGVQILMAAKRAAEARGIRFALTDHSERVLQVFEMLDLAAYFDDPLVLSGRPGQRT